MAKLLAPPPVLIQPTRRRFVQGLTFAGAAAAFGRSPAFADVNSGSLAQLSGDRIDLTVGPLPFNVTGRPRVATAVNGSVPAPILRLREGDLVTINVTNRLDEPTSIHWHGILLPADMDGVPGLSFRGIAPGETFTYRFRVKQAGTYWYHSHSGMQEQTGLYGPLTLVPRGKERQAYDRDYVILLSDWTDEDPMTVVSNLKQQSDYYNYRQRTLGTFVADVKQQGLKATLADRVMWGKMRMSPTDIMDVTGATYTFLVNGQPPAANWTGLFNPGEKVRLRFINGSSMTTFDVRLPGLPLKVIAADGNDVEPVTVGEFRIGVAEVYDVIVEPRKDAAYTIFAQAQDRSGYARATLAPRSGMAGAIPPLDPRPIRTTADMGMAGMGGMPGMDHSGMDMNMPGMDMSGMGPGSMSSAPAKAPVVVNADGVDPKTLHGKPFVDNMAVESKSRLGEAGTGLDGNGRKVLVYTDLKALKPNHDMGAPEREIEFHLTGNMERWVWGFDGKKFSEAGPIRVKLGERVRFVLINDTMMEHPIHLHGFLFLLENGNDGQLPLKHTVNVKPGERMSFVFTADTPGYWAFHCHLLYHMETDVPHRGGGMKAIAKAVMGPAAAFMLLTMPANAQMSDMAPSSAAPFGAPVDDQHVWVHAILDQFEGRFGDGAGRLRWQGEAWAGTDMNRIKLKSEGEWSQRSGVEDGRQEIYYSRPISRYFDVQIGGRYDLDSLAGRGWAAFGIEGLAPMFFHVSATAYVSNTGHYAAKLEGSYDLLITQRLILQPELEMNFYAKDDADRHIGSGLSDLDASLRLRYEITRKFAPYIGVTYELKFGRTARFIEAEGEKSDAVRFTVGVRVWL